MTESESKVLTFTSKPAPPTQTKVQIVEIPMPVLVVTGRAPTAERAPRTRQLAVPACSRNRTLTTEEKRMKKIRGLLAKFRECPDPETYCHWMDRAKIISLPKVCRDIPHGPKTYREAYEIPRFAAAIRSEKSRAWNGLD